MVEFWSKRSGRAAEVIATRLVPLRHFCSVRGDSNEPVAKRTGQAAPLAQPVHLPVEPDPPLSVAKQLLHAHSEIVAVQVAGLDQTRFVGEDDSLDAVAQFELRQDVREMRLDRRLAEKQ